MCNLVYIYNKENMGLISPKFCNKFKGLPFSYRGVNLQYIENFKVQAKARDIRFKCKGRHMLWQAYDKPT